MRKCIWCRRTAIETDFKKEAHTIPKQLGGRNICGNVCDDCNSYFGTLTTNSRLYFLKSDNDVGKNKTLPRFTSTYFNIDFNNKILTLKPQYKLHSYFQENVALQLKRGLYKMFLEERERQFRDGHNSQFDFIREYSRYNIGDYPIYYFERRYGAILMLQEWARHPQFFFSEDNQMKYLVNDYGFMEFEFLSHVFGIPVSRTWELGVSIYLKREYS